MEENNENKGNCLVGLATGTCITSAVCIASLYSSSIWQKAPSYSHEKNIANTISSEFRDLGAKVEDLDKDGDFEVVAKVQGKDYVIGKDSNGAYSFREFKLEKEVETSYDFKLK